MAFWGEGGLGCRVVFPSFIALHSPTKVVKIAKTTEAFRFWGATCANRKGNHHVENRRLKAVESIYVELVARHR